MSNAIEEIKRRCEEAGLEYEDDSPQVLIWFPRGTETYDLYVEPGSHAEWVANEPFDEYVRLEGYEASWSRNRRMIECNLILIEDYQGPSFYTGQRLVAEAFKRLGREQHGSSFASQRVHFEPVNGLSISIGWCSNVHAFVQEATGYADDLEDEDDPEDWNDFVSQDVQIERSLTIQISGTDVADHDSAIELLKRVGNSLLFQIDVSYQLGLALQRERPRRVQFPAWSLGEREDRKPLPPIKYQYDPEAMSLYWYARAATATPLLRFLAYYQIIEFYFPKYAHHRAMTTIRNVLKDPRFDALRDTDVMKVFEAIRVNSKGRFRSEVQQLEAAIEHCIQPEELRDFFLSNKWRYAFYDSEYQTKVARAKIPLRGPSFDHHKDVARRVYEIRCRIVHTKAGYEEQEPLLPFDPEVEFLRFDIDLIEFLARKVLMEASTSQPLQT